MTPQLRAATGLVSPDEAPAVALSLPETVEQDHYGRPSYRAAEIFALERRAHERDPRRGRHPDGNRNAPDACEQVWWGKRLAALGVTRSRVDRQFLRGVLTDAWEQKAPRRLLTR